METFKGELIIECNTLTSKLTQRCPTQYFLFLINRQNKEETYLEVLKVGGILFHLL